MMKANYQAKVKVFLVPRRDVRTNLDFQWNMSNIEFQLSGERKFYRFKEFESTIYTFRQNLSWDLFGNTIWNLNTVQSFTESTNLDTDLYNLELSVEWQPLINLSIRPRLGAWKRFDERESLTADPLAKNERDDLFITAGFTLRWTYRKVTAQMAYFHNQRTTTTQQATSRESSTKDHRVMFNMTRRFF